MILGPDGRPLPPRVTLNDEEDYEYADGRERVTISPRKTLMEMALRQRGGASLRAIITEFELIGEARNPRILQNALDRGHALLREAEALAAARDREEGRA